MAEKFRVEPEHLRGYAGMLERNAQHFLAIRQHAETKGSDTSGFTGVLALLQPVVIAVGKLYGETLEFANERLTGVSNAVKESAEVYEKDDQANSERIKQVESIMGEATSLGGRE
ncbi:Excreted virulence factor EspC, type VII ESX diderm [Saccharopolyspora antimicrobica]|uniref:Excreted virulence factor EspC (Type VII ESX diderm) n=1 Tax=Saccharopolyspora antimicrobica TaxID=455193 RepID=A0A1I5FEM4_9PSEU|nr:type VII secretion target [Saccharopolyspora antimicrobica]RKT82099.1 excreted virulence factor EspC (type VII ESX diderm) [Saccharopolyspora antimicrobica]SFO22160.1 Excreted virulence factor EspC, type VII ESX diderm [Saccharopolyspora antimicrobica]